MPIPPDNAELLKVVDVQHLSPTAIPHKAGSNGDTMDDIPFIISTMMIEDHKFRRINAKMGEAAVIPIGGAIPATAAGDLLYDAREEGGSRRYKPGDDANPKEARDVNGNIGLTAHERVNNASTWDEFLREFLD